MNKDKLNPTEKRFSDSLGKHQKELCSALRKQLYGCPTPAFEVLLGKDPESVKKRHAEYLDGVNEQVEIAKKMHQEIWGEDEN